MRLAIDVHGGDQAPDVILASVLDSAQRFPSVTFILIGQKTISVPKLSNIKHVIADELILDTDDPVMAVREKSNSSLVLGCLLLADGEVDVFLSAGNTGALLVAGLLKVGRIKGVLRPALSIWYPSLAGGRPKLILDVGANPVSKSSHIIQYALMGSLYYKHFIQSDNPRVALLNIGKEANKGTDVLKHSYELLSDLSDSGLISFVGNLEARDAMTDICDVLVTDGMSGNILLKTSEGVATEIFLLFKKIFTKSFSGRLAAFLLRERLQKVRQTMNYHSYGCAPLLGLVAPVLKVHGNANKYAWIVSLEQAQVIAKQDIMQKIAIFFQDEYAKWKNQSFKEGI